MEVVACSVSLQPSPWHVASSSSSSLNPLSHRLVKQFQPLSIRKTPCRNSYRPIKALFGKPWFNQFVLCDFVLPYPFSLKVARGSWMDGCACQCVDGCMYVRMSGWMYRFMYGCVRACLDGCMYRGMYMCLNGWMCECTNGWMLLMYEYRCVTRCIHWMGVCMVEWMYGCVCRCTH